MEIIGFATLAGIAAVYVITSTDLGRLIRLEIRTRLALRFLNPAAARNGFVGRYARTRRNRVVKRYAKAHGMKAAQVRAELGIAR